MNSECTYIFRIGISSIGETLQKSYTPIVEHYPLQNNLVRCFLISDQEPGVTGKGF